MSGRNRNRPPHEAGSFAAGDFAEGITPWGDPRGGVGGTMRAALYWAPEVDDPLHALGATWLGRDPETAATLPQPAIPGFDLAEATAEARRYGLHATLKAPFRLAQPFPALREAVLRLAAGTEPFALPPLSLESFGGFLALREAAPCPALHHLADEAVRQLDPCRAPLSEAERARRRPERLDARRRENLDRWGYPEVFEDWRFHVTLTRRLLPEEEARVRPVLERHLGDIPARPRRITSVSLFTQGSPEVPFLISERFTLGASASGR